MRGISGPTARNHPRIRRWVVGWSPRHPPVLDVDPRGLQTSRNPAPRGRISPVFWPLRCKVEGGWGGSAHYPDPTAQSVRPEYAERRLPARAGPPPPGAQPASSALPDLPKNAKFLLFSVVVESCALERGERGGGASIACGDVSHGRPSRPCPMAEVLTDSIGGHPRPDLARSNVLCEALPDLTGRSSRRAAFGSRKRPPPSRNLTVLRGLPSLL